MARLQASGSSTLRAKRAPGAATDSASTGTRSVRTGNATPTRRVHGSQHSLKSTREGAHVRQAHGGSPSLDPSGARADAAAAAVAGRSLARAHAPRASYGTQRGKSKAAAQPRRHLRERDGQRSRDNGRMQQRRRTARTRIAVDVERHCDIHDAERCREERVHEIRLQHAHVVVEE